MSTRQIIEIALFTAVAVVLTMISIPMPIPAMQELGLKIDISVVFIYLVFARQGSKAGYISLFITMALNELVKPGFPPFVGTLTYIAAFLVFYYSFNHKHYVRAVIVTAIVMTIANFFLITPVYTLAYGFEADSALQAYKALVTSDGYLIMILSIYPLFNFIQWSINAILIKAINKDKK